MLQMQHLRQKPHLARPLTSARDRAHHPRVHQHISGRARSVHSPDPPYHHQPGKGYQVACLIYQIPHWHPNGLNPRRCYHVYFP